MRIFTIIFCLFLSANAMAQSRDTLYTDAHKKLVLKNGDKPAYIEVDGKVYNGRLESIDTSKISSIDVLKSDDGVKLYGPQAANGVILITTKKAKISADTLGRIRCMATITNSAEPLYIINGKISKDGLSTVNPDDILSVDVLKDAKATAIYGAAGANGVVLLTTKKTANRLDSTKNETNIVINDAPPSHKNKVLFVIDGKQTYTYATDNKNMPNPSSIESIDILKPNAAMLRYGKLGKNGAVIIRTKNGAIPLYQKKLSALSQKYREYLFANHNDDAAIYYVINGEVINGNPIALDKKFDKLSEGQIVSIEFYEKWSKPLNNEHILLVIKTK